MDRISALPEVTAVRIERRPVTGCEVGRKQCWAIIIALSLGVCRCSTSRSVKIEMSAAAALSPISPAAAPRAAPRCGISAMHGAEPRSSGLNGAMRRRRALTEGDAEHPVGSMVVVAVDAKWAASAAARHTRPALRGGWDGRVGGGIRHARRPRWARSRTILRRCRRHLHGHRSERRCVTGITERDLHQNALRISAVYTSACADRCGRV